MDIHFTARKFKAQKVLRDLALDSIQRLDHFYDGIIRSDIVLSFERKPKSLKVAEIKVHVGKRVLTAKVRAAEFAMAIDQAIEKLLRQIDTMKSKSRKDKTALRVLKEDRSQDEVDTDA
jgi:ribosomal subunit interface protein